MYVLFVAFDLYQCNHGISFEEQEHCVVLVCVLGMQRTTVT